MAKAKAFSEASVDKIRRVVRQVLGEPQFGLGETNKPPSFGLLTYLGKTDGSGITARSGTTPGSGTVTLYYISGGTLTSWKDRSGSAITKTCYNMSETAVAATAYVIMMQELLSGKLFAVWEDC